MLTPGADARPNRYPGFPMRLIGLLAPALLVAMACGESASGPERRAGVPDDALAVTADSVENLFYHYRFDGPLETRERIVVREESRWAAHWEPLTRVELGFVIEPVDFGQHMVIIASMGRRNTGGFQVRIDGVYRRGSDLFVVVHEITPGRCLVTQAETTPITAARVPRVSGTVYWVERKSVHHCE